MAEVLSETQEEAMNTCEAIPVPYRFLETCAEKNSCSTLDMENPFKSKGTVIIWRGAAWVCTGSVSRGHRYLSADLRKCLPAEMYDGPENDRTKRGPAYYTGGRFLFQRKVWVMTDLEIEIVESSEKVPAQLSLFES